MIGIFLETLPFFLLIACGYGAAFGGVFSGQAVAHLTKFVFYFALSAMLFSFASSLSFQEIFDPDFALAYTSATALVYAVVFAAAILRKTGAAEAAVEAHSAIIGNIGFLGLPMLVLLLGPAAAGPLLLLVAIDLILFGSVIVIVITLSRGGAPGIGVFKTIGGGLVRNPMIVSMAAGLIWSALGLSTPGPIAEFLTLLGAAATPCALFAIGASLADKSAERVSVAIWLSLAKLVLHPSLIAISALWIFKVEPFAASVMICCAAMPTAGNVYILAQHYGVAPARVSSTILVSTAISVVTLSLVIAMVS